MESVSLDKGSKIIPTVPDPQILVLVQGSSRLFVLQKDVANAVMRRFLRSSSSRANL